MRLLILILLFPFVSNSQVIMTQRYTSSAAPIECSNKLLNDYEGAVVGLSLRLLYCPFQSSSCIRVRRSSDDAEQDIGFTALGDLDTSSMKSFVTSNSAYVVTWYDQSGNGYNASQSTQAKQPRIMNAGVIERQNSLPTIRFGYSGDNYLTISGITVSQPNTYFIVGQSSGTDDHHFIDGTTGSRQIIGFNSGNFITYAGSVLNHVTTSSAIAFQLMTTLFNSSSSTIQINAGSTTTGNAGSSAITGMNIGAGGTNLSINGYMSEVVCYPADMSASVSGIKTNINTYYSIY